MRRQTNLRVLVNCFALSLRPHAYVYVVCTLPWKRGHLFPPYVRARCRLASDLCSNASRRRKRSPTLRDVWFSSNHVSVCRYCVCCGIWDDSNLLHFFSGSYHVNRHIWNAASGRQPAPWCVANRYLQLVALKTFWKDIILCLLSTISGAQIAK